MRRLVTFIVRLWVEDPTEPSAWEGQVECVADGARGPLRAPEDLLRFIEAHAATRERPPTNPEPPATAALLEGHTPFAARQKP